MDGDASGSGTVTAALGLGDSALGLRDGGRSGSVKGTAALGLGEGDGVARALGDDGARARGQGRRGSSSVKETAAWYLPVIESDDDTFDDMDGKKKSKNPALVMWYLPVIDRLKHLFSNPREAELMRWHAENRKQNNKQIRHPADASQWKNFDLMYPEFAKETRNVRFALGTDGMNPFGEKKKCT